MSSCQPLVAPQRCRREGAEARLRPLYGEAPRGERRCAERSRGAGATDPNLARVLDRVGPPPHPPFRRRVQRGEIPKKVGGGEPEHDHDDWEEDVLPQPLRRRVLRAPRPCKRARRGRVNGGAVHGCERPPRCRPGMRGIEEDEGVQKADERGPGL
eukprot:gene2090-biopygen513